MEAGACDARVHLVTQKAVETLDRLVEIRRIDACESPGDALRLFDPEDDVATLSVGHGGHVGQKLGLRLTAVRWQVALVFEHPAFSDLAAAKLDQIGL